MIWNLINNSYKVYKICIIALLICFRRKSLHVVMKNQHNLPDPHRQSYNIEYIEHLNSYTYYVLHSLYISNFAYRPGWTSQQIKTVDVDCRIAPGWSIAPLSKIHILKVQNEKRVYVVFVKI